MKPALVLTLALLAGAAHADGPRRVAPLPEAYVRECGACHAPFAPGLLPASSWQRLMAGLDRHYGSDAALDAPTTAALAAWLQANAGTGRRASAPPPEDRITRADWFARKHREVDPRVWRDASVRSAANCGACHADAARGDYDEHRLRVPAGLDPRLARAWHD
jgi:hypothetical protein